MKDDLEFGNKGNKNLEPDKHRNKITKFWNHAKDKFAKEEFDSLEEEYYEDEEYAEEEEYYEDEEYAEEEEYYEDEEYAEEEEYYEDEEYAEEEEYYEDEEYAEEEEYYEDEEYAEEEEYYEEEEYAEEEEYYEDEEYAEEEEYYEDEEYAEEEEYYEDEEYTEEEEYYENEEDYIEEWDETEEYLEKHNIDDEDTEELDMSDGESPFLASIKNFFRNMSAIDAIIAGTGVVVLIIAIVTAGFWLGGRNKSTEASNMADIGQQLSGVGIIGESGLLAVTDALAGGAYIDGEEEETESTEEEKDAEVVDVNVNFTSVEKDLKVKFTNESNGKLVTGVLFEIDLTDSKGKTQVLTDDDKDGVIYQTKMKAGSYQVTLKSIGSIQFPTKPITVKVKDKIEYKKIDIADEIKTEAQVNVSKEDTEKKVEVESTLKDTVEFVPSTKTPVDGAEGYQGVDKGTIPNPNTTSKGAGFLSFGAPQERSSPSDPNAPSVTGVTVSGGGTVKKGATLQLSATVNMSDGSSSNSVSWSSGNSSIATVDGSGNVKGEGKGKTTIMATSTADTSVSGTLEIEVTEESATVASVVVSQTSLTLKVPDTQKLTATVTMSDGATNNNVTWKSSDDTVATVTGGTITAVKEGTATITATTTEKDKDGNSKSATCTVTVSKATPTIKVTKVAITPAGPVDIAKGLTTQLTATVTVDAGSAAATGVTWTSSALATATVDTNGKVTAVKEGTATITATSKDDATKTATCTINVKPAAALTVTLPATGTVKQGEAITLTPTITNGTGTNRTVKWASAQPKIASVDANGRVTGVGVGTAKITVSVKEGTGAEVLASCNVTVTKDASKDSTTKLKDNGGRQVFIKDGNGNYREATYADYFNNSAFYVKGGTAQYKYTGWQTIDNKTYYFDKNGNKITGEQVIQGVKYNFGSDGSLSMASGTLGIDVSKWNNNINWTAVRASGVSYAIIRCGYRGSSTGALIEDPKFKANIKGAQAAGIKVGVYFFTQAINEVEAVEEASMVLSQIKGYSINYPVFIDTEGSGGRADGLDRGTRTAVVNAFCQTIKSGGYTPGIYASKSWFDSKLNTGSLSGYKIWLAQYAAQPTYNGRYDLWQYTSKGSIGGINGNVDLNQSYLGY